MASKAGQPPTDLIQDLQDNTSGYEFFQALRLLSRLRACAVEDIAIRPELSLDYPLAEVSGLEQDDNGALSLVTSFMGLYGISSPLPLFYTEDLLDEASEEESVGRDFLDIIHHHLYPLLYRAWLKYRLAQQMVEEDDSRYWQVLFSLLGLGDDTLLQKTQQPRALLPYLGLLVQRPRSLLGLETLLRAAFSVDNLHVVPCVKRQVNIAEEQKAHLGENALLGQSVLGERVVDRMGKCAVHIETHETALFQQWLRNRAQRDKLLFLVQFYLDTPLAVDLVLKLAQEPRPRACLGATAWTGLGEDAWLGTAGETLVTQVSLIA